MSRNNISSTIGTIRVNNQNMFQVTSPNGAVTQLTQIDGVLYFSEDDGLTWNSNATQSNMVGLFSAMAESWFGASTTSTNQSELNIEIANKLKNLDANKLSTTGGAVTGNFQVVGANTFLYIGANNPISDTAGDIRLANTSIGLQVQLCSVGAVSKGGGTWSVVQNSLVIDNLSSTSSTNPLSANMGKFLKDLIDSITILGPMTQAQYDAMAPSDKQDRLVLISS
jgi:hypothetical protein